MNCLIQIPTTSLAYCSFIRNSLVHFSSNPTRGTLIPSNYLHPCIQSHSNLRQHISLKRNLEPVKKRRLQILCAVGSDGETGNWTKWLPRGVVSADKLLRFISSATSSPICQFISSPSTFLHAVDPRIKLVISLLILMLLLCYLIWFIFEIYEFAFLYWISLCCLIKFLVENFMV